MLPKKSITPRLSLRALACGSLVAVATMTSGCGTLLPNVPEFKVTNMKATPDELLAPSSDPIDQGSVKPFTPSSFSPVEISTPTEDQTFGLTFTEKKGPWAQTQNTSQLLANGRRVIDPQGPIYTWSPLSDTGYITYLVQETRVGKVQDGLTHYDLKLLDVRTAGKTPVKIARYATNGARHLWSFGKDEPIQVQQFFLTSRGVVTLREDSTVVTYFEAGKAPFTSALPVGYKVADFGVDTDIAYGKHLRILQHRGPHKLFGVLPSSQEELYDVSFWNVERGEKTATAKDIVVNVTSETSFRNYVEGKAQMVNSPSGPFAITVEDTLKKTIVRNLATLQKVTLVETSVKQGHGFSTGFETRRAGGMGAYGKVWVNFAPANGELSNKKIIDLESWMKNPSPTLLRPAT